MNSPRRQEMDKLRAIQRQVEGVAQRLDARLPQQRRHLAAFVCATKWRLQTITKKTTKLLTQEALDATAKKMRMEIGAHVYAAKEQSELLTRALFQLDDILSHGDAEIKDARKALVVQTQKLLEHADALNASAEKLKQFTDDVASRLPTAPGQDATMDEAAEVETPAAEVSTEDAVMDDVADEDDKPGPMATDDEDFDWEHVTADDIRPLFNESDEEEKNDDGEVVEEDKQHEATPIQPAESANEGADDHEEEKAQNDDEEEAETDDEEAENDKQEETQQNATDVKSLPVWRPYYQIQKRADGIYLIANLRGVDPRFVHVESMPHNGTVRISGVKLPTQKDIVLSHISGTPTFGRFEIVEQFPAQALNMENATQQLTRDGTLQVRLPFYLVQRPRVLRRVSPFQQHRLVAW